MTSIEVQSSSGEFDFSKILECNITRPFVVYCALIVVTFTSVDHAYPGIFEEISFDIKAYDAITYIALGMIVLSALTWIVAEEHLLQGSMQKIFQQASVVLPGVTAGFICIMANGVMLVYRHVLPFYPVFLWGSVILVVASAIMVLFVVRGWDILREHQENTKLSDV